MPGSLTAEWRAFRADPPGERFCNHYRRMKQHGSWVRVATLLLGIVLIAAGIVLLFIPGPGLLVMLFGFALLCGSSALLARGLDRLEPKARRAGQRVRRMWRSRSAKRAADHGR